MSNAVTNPSNFDKIHDEIHECYKPISIVTEDKVTLDAFKIINPEQKDKPPHEQKWLICFNPNSECYESNLEEYRIIAEKAGANLIAFNYRGVANSTGYPRGEQDLINDGMGVVEYLKKHEGVTSNSNILAYGRSQGGAIAVQTAKRSAGMHLCIDRSYDNYANAAKYLVGSLLGKTIGNIASKIISSFGNLFDSHAAFKEVTGHKFIIDHADDGVICPGARLGEAILKEWAEENADTTPIVITLNYQKAGAAKSDKGYMAHNYVWRSKHGNPEMIIDSDPAGQMFVDQLRKAFEVGQRNIPKPS
jgi:hypothetical protein